jgi:carboxyl-terminal processing protease
MEKTQSQSRGVVLLIVVLGASAVLGGMYGPSVRATAAESNNVQDSLKSFSRVLAVVERNYADPVDVDKSIYDGAIPGMLHALDPHSNFFDPTSFAKFREDQQGKYYGVGMQVAQRGNQVVVVAPFVGSPAFKAGIRPADVILKVGDKSCEGLTTDDVAAMLKGARGTSVQVTLGRVGWEKPIEVTVVRDEIAHPAVEYFTLLRPGIGYIRLTTFNNQTTDSDLAAAMNKLDYPKLDGLIIDLRDNGGGLLNQAVGMADMFLDRNEIVVSQHGRSSPEQRFYAVHGNQGLAVPLVILANSGTASASEIVAGAIQDHDRGLIVGETSFGKGLVQTPFPLPEDTMLLLTSARYYTPSGRSIQRDYKNVSLFDYHYNPQRPHSPEVKLTDSGRQVYGEGGITPDVIIAAPKLDGFEQFLDRRGVFYPYSNGVGDFVRFYLGNKPEITRDFVVNDAVIEQFRKYLTDQQIKFTDQDIADNLAWLKLKIKREVFTTVFGLNDGFKIALQGDPQLDKAVDLIPQARALYQNARKVLAERETVPTDHP